MKAPSFGLDYFRRRGISLFLYCNNKLVKTTEGQCDFERHHFWSKKLLLFCHFFVVFSPPADSGEKKTWNVTRACPQNGRSLTHTWKEKRALASRMPGMCVFSTPGFLLGQKKKENLTLDEEGEGKRTRRELSVLEDFSTSTLSFCGSCWSPLLSLYSWIVHSTSLLRVVGLETLMNFPLL